MAKSFYKDIVIEVRPDVYEPREDSILIAEAIENELKNGEKKVLEIGCGSGLLSIIAAKRDCDVTSVDIDEKALECARDNAKTNNIRINFLRSDIFSSVSGKFDLIIFNPPYLPEKISEFSRTWAGGENVEIITRFIKDAKSFLSPSGKVLIIISSLTGLEKILREFELCGFSPKVISERKVPWETLFVISAPQSKFINQPEEK